MAVSYVYEEDEELVKYIKSKIPKELKSINAVIYLTDNVEDISNLTENSNKTIMVITKNYSKEFVTFALEKTNHLIYKLCDRDLIVGKITKVLEKIKSEK